MAATISGSTIISGSGSMTINGSKITGGSVTSMSNHPLTITVQGTNGKVTMSATNTIAILKGGKGNGTYLIDKDDKIIEKAGEGIDTAKGAFSMFRINLAKYANVENAILTGTAGDNSLKSKKADNKMYGKAGKDSFAFNTRLGPANVDTIVKFESKDVIQLDNAVFTKLTKTGTLASRHFHASKTGKAQEKHDFILYNTKTGPLFYDADGSGKGAAIELAVIGNKVKLVASDFDII